MQSRLHVFHSQKTEGPGDFPLFLKEFCVGMRNLNRSFNAQLHFFPIKLTVESLVNPHKTK